MRTRSASAAWPSGLKVSNAPRRRSAPGSHTIVTFVPPRRGRVRAQTTARRPRGDVRSPQAGMRAGADSRPPPPPPQPPPARPPSRGRQRRRAWRISASFGASSLPRRTRESTRTILPPPPPSYAFSASCFGRPPPFSAAPVSPSARRGIAPSTSPSPSPSHCFRRHCCLHRLPHRRPGPCPPEIDVNFRRRGPPFLYFKPRMPADPWS